MRARPMQKKYWPEYHLQGTVLTFPFVPLIPEPIMNITKTELAAIIASAVAAGIKAAGTQAGAAALLAWIKVRRYPIFDLQQRKCETLFPISTD